MNEDELLLAYAKDKINQCADRSVPTGTGFLDPHQQSVVRTAYGSGDAVTRIIYYGGYDDAERVMMICLPDYVLMPQQAGGSTEGIDEVISDLMCVIRVTHSDRSLASKTGRPLSHSDYLLMPHPELAERAEDPYPDTYCPSNPGSYELLFDLLEEVIEVLEPKIVNIGHDEYYSVGLCDKCKNKPAEELLAGDITKIHDFLAERGVKTMMWGDKRLKIVLP